MLLWWSTCGWYVHRIWLRQINIYPGSYSTKSGVVLPLLRFLQYNPGGSKELGLLMASLRVPGLVDLHISLGEGDDMPIAHKCEGMFGTAIRMRIISAYQTKANVHVLYAMTPAVSSLDIVFTALSFHYALHDSEVLPTLRTIVESALAFPLLQGVAKWQCELDAFVLYRPTRTYQMPDGMAAEERLELLELVAIVEYVSVLLKEWYM